MKKKLIIACVSGFILNACTPKISISTTKNEAQVHEVKHELNGKIFIREYDQNGQLSFNDELAAFFNEWKKDSNNLNGFRNSYIHALSQENHFFTGIKKSDIIQYMGVGNSKKNDLTMIRFNLESGCGKPEFDCCWMILYFDENQMVTYSSIACS